MKPRKGSYEYQYLGNTVRVPATIVGDLAIYRLGARWNVHHVPTRAHAHKALPARFINPQGLVWASKRDLVAWAAAWQAAAPEFFAMMATMTPAGDVHYAGDRHALAAAAIEAGRAP